MKRFALSALVVCGGTAAADPAAIEDVPPAPPVQAPHGASIDVGATLGRVEPFSGTVLSFETLHIAPRISVHNIIYIGVDLDIGRLSGNGQSQQSVIGGNPITNPGRDPAMPNVPLDGSIAMVRGVLGARLFTGPFSGGAELAAGARDLHVKDVTQAGGTNFFDAVYDARARFDFWATPRISIGALAEAGLEDRHDLSVGLVVGLHMMPYDAAR